MTLNEVENIAIPESISDASRVWIYQSSRALTDDETEKLNALCDEFTKQWAAHGQNLVARHRIYFNRFLCLFVDESAHGASGCSIDSSVRFIKNIEREMQIVLMNRTEVAFMIDGTVQIIPMNEIPEAISSGSIDANTPVFNNTVSSVKQMREAWITPASKTWVSRFF
ncbi:MAG: ABC transporter ATPase [Flavobacteriales bacterium]|nr:ABC transporter ATPase [Flavobacteriales bacterium]